MVNEEKSVEDQKVEEDSIVVVEEKNDGVEKEDPLLVSGVERNSYKGESDINTNLGENERRALLELRSKIEEAILEKKLNDDVKDNVELWGIPLLASKGDKRTNIILLKFLRAKDFNSNNAFEMLKKTLLWRKDNSVNSIIDEDNYSSIAFMQGNDLEGHPICYNVCGVFENDEMYEKILGSEEKREKFLKWRIQLMEKGIEKLDFKPSDNHNDSDGISTIVQVIDLKNTPLPTRKELRVGLKKVVELFQDNYPEFSAKIILINVPFWYYAFSALFAPSLTERTKNKFVSARPSKVMDTLLKYIAVEELPIQYGGLKGENDTDFNTEHTSKEVIIKARTTEIIEIPAPEVGNLIIWDFTVSGWDVNYKEEFVPTDDKSYTIIVQRARKITSQDGPIRNSFQNKEPGNIVITIENSSFKKKRILYRYKAKTPPSSSS